MTADAEDERRERHIEMLRKYVEYHCWVTTAKEKGRFFHFESIAKCANFNKLRRELKKRGFVELNRIPNESYLLEIPNSILLEEAKDGNEYEQALMAKMIGRRKPDLVFLSRAIEYRNFHSTPFLSKISFHQPPSFICKNGMLRYVEVIKQKKLNKGVYFPRAYDVSSPEGVNQFLEDYRLTAALSLVLYLYRRLRFIEIYFTDEQCRQDGCKNGDSADGDTVRINGLDYAIHVIFMHIKYADGNLSRDELARYNLNQAQWREVLDTHAGIVKHGRRISYANNVAMKEYVVAKIKILGPDIPLYWPNIYHDGIHNMWLLKPAYTGQGWGIILESDERRLLDLMKNKANHYICQK